MTSSPSERRERAPALVLPNTPEQREHLANVLRLRVAVALGAVIWPAFALLDWLVVAYVYPNADLSTALWVRFAPAPLQLLFMYRLSRRPAPGPTLLSALDLTNFVWVSAALGVLSALLGGITGPYTPGVFIVLICRNAFLVQSWRRSVLPNALIVLAHFVTLGAAEAFSPGSVFRLGGASARTLLLLQFCSLTCGAIMLGAASHSAWALRRRVFEARHLGRYRLVQRIAEGGYGEVWRAYHVGLRQDVAIKVLRGEVAESERALVRFEREIDALCRLRHPHTVRILDYGVTRDGVCYYAMELLEGVTLAALVHDQGPLEPARAIHLALQIANALAEAHQHGIVHRDVKPDNVFVLTSWAEDFAKLIDFGIAKRRDSEELASHVTRTGVVVGTPAFMAPEVAAGQRADFRADVYGVGALLLFMLTGRAPADVEATTVATSVPADLARVMWRCLVGKPHARFADARALAAALAALEDAFKWRPRAAPCAQRSALSLVPTRTN